MMMTFIRCVFVALMLTPALSAAQSFDAGVAAYNSGDFATAVREWTPLAEQGDASAQNNLGNMYDNGNGVPQDYAEAAKWYRLAAEQGNAEAQFNLGRLYGKGEGVAQDYAEALKWFRLAAEQGNAGAQYLLGVLYTSGLGVAQDYGTAHMWFNIAAANGHEKARENRDNAAGLMTAEAVVDAQQRAKVCMASNYQDCD